MAGNSIVRGQIIRGFMVVLGTCKDEEDSIKTKGPKMSTTLYVKIIFQTLNGRQLRRHGEI